MILPTLTSLSLPFGSLSSRLIKCLEGARLCAGYLGKLLLAGLIFLLFSSSAWAAGKVVVLYPELPSPYKGIFQTILDGINSQNDFDYRPYPLADNYRLSDLEAFLDRQKPAALIALGKRGYLAVTQLQTELPVIQGALPLVPNGVSGVSLSSDPEQLFTRLKSLVPESRRVFVVYSPQVSGWLIPLAKEAAEKNALELIALPAKTLREAMHRYREVLRSARGRKDAIWLPLDRITVSEEIVLPMLLREAWDKDLVLCSSKPTHAERGALFSMYPDHFGLGQELARFTARQMRAYDRNLVTPLKRLHTAVNLRTAAHLGLNFSQQEEQAFNLTFPAR